jgi:hypothetical protein
VQIVGGALEAAVRGDGSEVAKVPEFHGAVGD